MSGSIRPARGTFELIPADPNDFSHLDPDASSDKRMFFPGEEEDEQEEENNLDELVLRIVHNPRRNTLEQSVNFRIETNVVIAKRYRIVEYLGSGVFSRATHCVDTVTGQQVCVKITRNNKDFFDQSLGEIKLLKRLNEADPSDSKNIMRMFDYFYHKEHLFIVCELLCDNLYELYKNVLRTGNTPYFTLPRIRSIAHQCLIALDFMHSHKLIHCDLKPENIMIKSLSRCTVKVIDLGSSCFEGDPHSSYVQSRSYRAPEVVLGLPFNNRIDLFSLGCILAELIRGKVLFPNKTSTHLLAGHMALSGIEKWMIDEGRYAHLYFKDYKLFIWQAHEVNNAERSETIKQQRKRHIRNGTGGYFYINPKARRMEGELGVSEPQFLDFMSQLLCTDMRKRPSAEEALRHEWMAGAAQSPPSIYRPSRSEDYVESQSPTSPRAINVLGSVPGEASACQCSAPAACVIEEASPEEKASAQRTNSEASISGKRLPRQHDAATDERCVCPCSALISQPKIKSNGLGLCPFVGSDMPTLMFDPSSASGKRANRVPQLPILAKSAAVSPTQGSPSGRRINLQSKSRGNVPNARVGNLANPCYGKIANTSSRYGKLSSVHFGNLSQTEHDKPNAQHGDWSKRFGNLDVRSVSASQASSHRAESENPNDDQEHPSACSAHGRPKLPVSVWEQLPWLNELESPAARVRNAKDLLELVPGEKCRPPRLSMLTPSAPPCSIASSPSSMQSPPMSQTQNLHWYEMLEGLPSPPACEPAAEVTEDPFGLSQEDLDALHLGW